MFYQSLQVQKTNMDNNWLSDPLMHLKVIKGKITNIFVREFANWIIINNEIHSKNFQYFSFLAMLSTFRI